MNVSLSNVMNVIPTININKQPQIKPSFKGQSDTFEKGLTLKGSETQAKIYTTNVDYETLSQVKVFCNHPVFKDTPIRIMPDTHAGKNSVVGFSAPIINGKVIPNIIGGDIGCGMLCVKIDTQGKDIDFEKLDDVIKTYVSSSREERPASLNKVPDMFLKEVSDLCKYKYKKSPEKVMDSLGTLGGGNHFIEIDKSADGEYNLVIHTGSRHFGKEVADHHQKIANEQNPYKIRDLSYLSGDEANQYLQDMKIAADYSRFNRKVIADEIMKRMGWKEKESFESIHNYISQDGIIRKGAICADDGKQVIIPLNMRDGAILGTGKGNAEWNNTAPHGAGRQYKRSQAAQFISFDDYKKSMQGIYSSGITKSHIDESPQAYKDSGEIIENIADTVDVQEIISPVFNYKD